MVIAVVDEEAVAVAAAAVVCLFMEFSAAIRTLFLKRFSILSAAVA